MTFAQLLASLERLDQDSALIFEIDSHVIGAGYHVTELRHSMSTGIDCGGHVETWQEARLQLLDGPGTAHMRVGKFMGIVKRSLSRIPALSDVPILVEFSPDNLGLRVLQPGAIVPEEGEVRLILGDTTAICKPARRSMNLEMTEEACCGVSTAASACCTAGSSAGAGRVCCS
ncbi:MAG: DUF6428 family protein [Pseudomonadota bacterium]